MSIQFKPTEENDTRYDTAASAYWYNYKLKKHAYAKEWAEAMSNLDKELAGLGEP